jgi:hypothetical protein
LIFYIAEVYNTSTAAFKKRSATGQTFQSGCPERKCARKGVFTMKGEMTQKGKEALERFKMESASEVGVTLNKGYNGDLTSRQAGSIGGQMVNMMSPEQQFEFIRSDVKSQAHTRILTYAIQAGI